MSKKKRLLIIIGLPVVIATVFVFFQLFTDWYTFQSEDNKIKSYISSLQSSDNVVAQKYCSYSHQKYSRGSLGCNFAYSFKSSNGTIFNDSKGYAQGFEWKFKWDNTNDNNKYSNLRYVKSEVYEYKNLSCSFTVTEDTGSYEYEVGCSGPAKAEWFPVRKD